MIADTDVYHVLLAEFIGRLTCNVQLHTAKDALYKLYCPLLHVLCYNWCSKTWHMSCAGIIPFLVCLTDCLFSWGAGKYKNTFNVYLTGTFLSSWILYRNMKAGRAVRSTNVKKTFARMNTTLIITTEPACVNIEYPVTAGKCGTHHYTGSATFPHMHMLCNFSRNY